MKTDSMRILEQLEWPWIGRKKHLQHANGDNINLSNCHTSSCTLRLRHLFDFSMPSCLVLMIIMMNLTLSPACPTQMIQPWKLRGLIPWPAGEASPKLLLSSSCIQVLLQPDKGIISQMAATLTGGDNNSMVLPVTRIIVAYEYILTSTDCIKNVVFYSIIKLLLCKESIP